jgi:mRNA interferase HigB
MNIVKRATLIEFWTRHPETEQPLRDWFKTAKTAGWTSMADIRSTYPKASVINAERAVFNICGGNYRLIVAFKFSARIAYVKFIGTHSE